MHCWGLCGMRPVCRLRLTHDLMCCTILLNSLSTPPVEADSLLDLALLLTFNCCSSMSNIPNLHSHGSCVVAYFRRPSRSLLLRYPLLVMWSSKTILIHRTLQVAICNLPSSYSTKNQCCFCTDTRIWLHYKATILPTITSMMNF